MIEFSDFQKVDMRVGTVEDVYVNKKAHQPAYVMKINFGAIGVKTTSAQITENYRPEDLRGRQVVAVVNFPPKQIADVLSEVLVLGAMSAQKDVVLMNPDQRVENGTQVG